MTTYFIDHTHTPNDPSKSQHGPNLHTHNAEGKVDTVMDIDIDTLKCSDCDNITLHCEHGYSEYIAQKMAGEIE